MSDKTMTSEQAAIERLQRMRNDRSGACKPYVGEPYRQAAEQDCAALDLAIAALRSRVVPEGWALVPRERLSLLQLTLDKMAGDTDPAYVDDETDEDVREASPAFWCYREVNAWIAASPSPPAPVAQGEEAEGFRTALEEIAREQSHATPTRAADYFQQIARDALTAAPPLPEQRDGQEAVRIDSLRQAWDRATASERQQLAAMFTTPPAAIQTTQSSQGQVDAARLAWAFCNAASAEDRHLGTAFGIENVTRWLTAALAATKENPNGRG